MRVVTVRAALLGYVVIFALGCSNSVNSNAPFGGGDDSATSITDETFAGDASVAGDDNPASDIDGSDGSSDNGPASTYIDWHPGLYAQCNCQVPRAGDTSQWTALEEWIAARGAEPGVVGVQLVANYGVLRPSSGAVGIEESYAAIDRILVAAKAVGLRVRFNLWIHQYIGDSTSLPDTPQSSTFPAVPDYWITNGWAGVHPTGEHQNAVGAKLSEAAAADDLIDWYQRMGDRYNVDSTFEGFNTFETANLAYDVDTYAATEAQVRRFLDEVKPHWPNKVTDFFINYFGQGFDTTSFNQTKANIEYAIAAKWGIEWPDLKSGSDQNFSDCIMKGQGTQTLTGVTGDCGTHDYAGEVPIAGHQEYLPGTPERDGILELSREVGNSYLVYSVCLPGQGCSATETWTGESGVHAWLLTQTQPLTLVDCPTMFAGTCRSAP